MNKLKNIGISALAGTLVSLSAAQAGGVSVTGAWELSYTNLNTEKVTGNKIGMKKNISFGASGDISDGGGVTWATTIGGTDAMGLSSASLSINMGGIATLAYDSGTGGYGANAVDNIVPTAWEEIDYGFSTGITDVGRVSASKGVINLTVKAPHAGTGISFSYVSRMGGGHLADGATDEGTGGRGMDLVVDLIDVNMAHFGFRWGMAGEIEIKQDSCHNQAQGSTPANNCSSGHKNNPYGASSYLSLKLGPISVGAQATFQDLQDPASTGIANKRSIVAGGALTIGDTISLSYGQAWDKYRYNSDTRHDVGAKTHEYEMVKFTGYSAAINMGPVALKGVRNHVGGAGENASSSPRSHSEVNLSIAF
jgi:hypothetical protein